MVTRKTTSVWAPFSVNVATPVFPEVFCSFREIERVVTAAGAGVFVGATVGEAAGVVAVAASAVEVAAVVAVAAGEVAIGAAVVAVAAGWVAAGGTLVAVGSSSVVQAASTKVAAITVATPGIRDFS